MIAILSLRTRTANGQQWLPTLDNLPWYLHPQTRRFEGMLMGYRIYSQRAKASFHSVGTPKDPILLRRLEWMTDDDGQTILTAFINDIC